MAETEKHQQSMDPIPIDVLFEMFLKLPVKSLAKFVCVSKLWAKIIRNQDFIKAVTFRSLQNKQPRLLFAFKDKIKGYQENWYFFSKSTNVSTPLYEPNPPHWFAAPSHDALNVEEPPDFESRMVCHFREMRYRHPSYVHGLISFLYGQEQVIYNPSIGKSITLPTLESIEKIVRSFLGYDPIHAQYKILCFTYVGPFCEHHVLTLGAQNCSWRMIQCSTPHYPGLSSVCIDGVLYYSASTGHFTVNEPVLVRFDLMSESLEIASVFPQGIKSLHEISLINYNGKVAVVSYVSNLWVLEDAKKQQWSETQRINLNQRSTKFHEKLEILGTSDMGEVIFAPNIFKVLVVYFLDHKSNQQRSVELEGNTKYKFSDFFEVFTFLHYVESVMLI